MNKIRVKDADSERVKTRSVKNEKDNVINVINEKSDLNESGMIYKRE